LLHGFAAIPLHEMLRDCANQFAPFDIVFRRIVRGAADGALGVVNLILRSAGNLGCKILWHEAELDHRTNACGLVFIKDAVEQREIVNGLA